MSSNVLWRTCVDFQRITIDNTPLLRTESPPYHFGKEGIFLILVLMEYGLGLEDATEQMDTLALS